MNCNTHVDTPANGFCLSCGQPFCKNCLGEYGYCQSCQALEESVQAENEQQRQANLEREQKSMKRRKNFSIFLLIVSPIPVVLWLIFVGTNFSSRVWTDLVIYALIFTSPWGLVSLIMRIFDSDYRSDADRLIDKISEVTDGCLVMLFKLALALAVGIIRWILAYFIVTIRAAFYLIEYKRMMKELEQ